MKPVMPSPPIKNVLASSPISSMATTVTPFFNVPLAKQWNFDVRVYKRFDENSVFKLLRNKDGTNLWW